MISLVLRAAIDAAGYPSVQSYSGRGMFGRRCARERAQDGAGVDALSNFEKIREKILRKKNELDKVEIQLAHLKSKRADLTDDLETLYAQLRAAAAEKVTP